MPCCFGKDDFSLFLFFLLSDFKCASWHPQEKFGYARELSFQHPIKIYLGMLLLLYIACTLYNFLSFPELGYVPPL
jgi:hypothetical protein